jgi:hypothetical protein
MYNDMNAAFGGADAKRPAGVADEATRNESLGFAANRFAENRKS